jgi:hypothetical protein
MILRGGREGHNRAGLVYGREPGQAGPGHEGNLEESQLEILSPVTQVRSEAKINPGHFAQKRSEPCRSASPIFSR